MTEAEWLTATDPTPMFDAVEDSSNDRKQRLLGCALCRSAWDKLECSPAARRLVEFVEAAADGTIPAADRDGVRAELENHSRNFEGGCERSLAGWGRDSAVGAVRWLYPERILVLLGQSLESATYGEALGELMPHPLRGWQGFLNTLRLLSGGMIRFRPAEEVVLDRAGEEERRKQVVSVRDIFGNPFRPVAFDPAWRTSTAVGLAQAIYDDRAFDRLPILADALQDAGCEDEQVLAHCRGTGLHARGCWVVDGVLGKGWSVTSLA